MRESWYYWVKFEDEWTIAEWNSENGSWSVFYESTTYTNELWEEIDERRIERE